MGEDTHLAADTTDNHAETSLQKYTLNCRDALAFSLDKFLTRLRAARCEPDMA
jgi:hypothetical protein